VHWEQADRPLTTADSSSCRLSVANDLVVLAKIKHVYRELRVGSEVLTDVTTNITNCGTRSQIYVSTRPHIPEERHLKL